MVALTAQAARAAASGWATSLLQSLPLQPDPLPAFQLSRRQATDLLATRPLPSRRHEAWRFTDPALLATIPATLLVPAAEAPVPSAPADTPGSRLRLDGEAMDPALLPAGIEPIGADQLALLSADSDPSAAPSAFGLGLSPEAPGCDADRDWIALLAAAAAPSPLALRVRGRVEATLELLSDTAAASGVLPRRVVLLLEPGASLDLLQVHRAAGSSLTAIQLEIRLGAGARLRHGLIAPGCETAALLADLRIQQAPESDYAFTSVVAGWGLSRIEPRVEQSAGRAQTCLRALQRVDGRQVADHHSQVRFKGPEGRLDQVHKAIAAAAGRSVFNGAVVVPRAAQRTDASQLSRSLLLSDRARVDTKPQLEIVADDVRCAHGATISRLQEEELFYLRSRGISATTAASLLVRGFCEEVLRELPPGASLWQPQSMLQGEEAPRP